MEPLEILAAPFTIWLAPVGEAFPAIDAAPAGNWAKLGSNGDVNYDEDGVVVTHGQTIENWRGLGSTGPVKAWRTEEELQIGFTLVDISAAQYAKVLNNVEVTQTASGVGVPGTDAFGLSQGREVAAFALLARGASPGMEGGNAQYEVKKVYQGAEPAPTFQKGEPAGLECEFNALEDVTAANRNERFGRLLIQTAAAG